MQGEGPPGTAALGSSCWSAPHRDIVCDGLSEKQQSYSGDCKLQNDTKGSLYICVCVCILCIYRTRIKLRTIFRLEDRYL